LLRKEGASGKLQVREAGKKGGNEHASYGGEQKNPRSFCCGGKKRKSRKGRGGFGDTIKQPRRNREGRKAGSGGVL